MQKNRKKQLRGAGPATASLPKRRPTPEPCPCLHLSVLSFGRAAFELNRCLGRPASWIIA